MEQAKIDEAQEMVRLGALAVFSAIEKTSGKKLFPQELEAIRKYVSQGIFDEVSIVLKSQNFTAEQIKQIVRQAVKDAISQI